jgi:hypothetical protein
MGQTKEQKVLKQMQNTPYEPKTAIATDMFLPNHSGIASHPEFKKALNEIDLSPYVPYTGATTDTNLGSFELRTSGLLRVTQNPNNATQSGGVQLVQDWSDDGNIESGRIKFFEYTTQNWEVGHEEDYDSGEDIYYSDFYIRQVGGSTYTPRYLKTNVPFYSEVTTGTAPLEINSTTLNTNLNADLLDGKHASELIPYENQTSDIRFNSAVYFIQTSNSSKINYSDGYGLIIEAGYDNPSDSLNLIAYNLDLNASNSINATADLVISCSNPSITFTEATNSESAVMEKLTASNQFKITNNVQVPGSAGNCIDFNGSTTYATMPYGNGINPFTQDLTFNFWVKFDDASPTGSFFGCNSTGTNQRLYMDIQGGKVRLVIQAAGSQIATSTTSVATNTWYNIGVTFKNGTCRLYFNGVNEASAVYTSYTFPTDVYIGKSVASASNCKIDELGVWTRELAGTEMVDFYNSGVGIYYASTKSFSSTGTAMNNNLYLLYHLDESSGNPADSSGNSRTGTNSSGTYGTGLILIDAGTETATILSSIDGATAGEYGRNTFGASNGRTILEGKTLRFSVGGVEQASFDANGDMTLVEGNNIITGTTTGTKIGTATTQKIGFYNVTPVVQPTALTTKLTQITHTAPGTPDYAIQDLTNSSGYGFVTKDEGNSVLKVILNLQTRVDELETKLKALGLLA